MAFVHVPKLIMTIEFCTCTKNCLIEEHEKENSYCIMKGKIRNSSFLWVQVQRDESCKSIQFGRWPNFVQFNMEAKER